MTRSISSPRGAIATSSRPFAALALAALLACAGGPALATHVGEELTGDQQVVQTADQLLGALRQFQNMPAAQRAAFEARLTQLAQQRRDRLVQLLERNPRLATLRVMPAALREEFPAAARAFIEQEATVGGEVAALVASDVARGFSRTEFRLRPASGPEFTLYLGDAEAGAAERELLRWTGRQVTVRGHAIGQRMIVADRREAQLVAAEGSTAPVAAGNGTPTITPVVTGDQRALVILANFTDKALTCSAADVNTRVFGATGASVNNGFREASRGLVSFSGNVVGPFTIPYSASGTCDFSAWGSAAESAARAAGIDPSQYRRVAYVTPSGGGCGWSGLAYMPGRQSWVQSCTATGVYTHEFGHNLSLHHSATPTSEYGDGSDPMGGARTVRNNGANQVMAGWVPTGGVLDVGSAGSYTLGALGPEAGTHTQVLRIAKPDTAETYYVSLRQATGLDALLSAGFLNNISIHRSTGRLPARTYLLQTLTPGASFFDSINGIQVTHQGVVGNAATVAVAFGGGSCARAAPGIVVAPASATAAAGTAASYTVSVTNNNSTACGTSTFNLSQVLPAGFSGSFGNAALSLAPAATASTSWQVRSGATTAEATYTLDMSTGDGVGAAASAHASMLVVVDKIGPALAVTSPAAGAVLSGRSVSIAATATDPAGVAGVEFYVDGRQLARDTSSPYSANWNLRKASKGVHTIIVRALDTLGNVSERTFEVTVQ